MNEVITRFAPSPTGFPHLGTAMYALLNYLYAHQHGGTVLMRSEDTDPVRSKPEYEKAIIEGLLWLGIKADDFYRQTDRLEIYKKYIAKMIADGTAYISPDTNEKGETRDVVRFKNPNKVITFHDSSRGDISVDTTDLKDFIIARDINSPLYHLTVVVDDYETGVTHVIRGEDGLANTPRQILIQEAIGAARPVYAHYPFIVLPNRTKMGKRNGAKSLQDYIALGYLPEAIVNFIILMAWHPKDDRELFTISELLKEFELERIGKSGAILDEKKLDWLNKEYLNRLSDEEFLEKLTPFIPQQLVKTSEPSEELFQKLLPLLRERIQVFYEVTELCERGELSCFFKPPLYEAENLIWKKGGNREETITHLQTITERMQKLSENEFSIESIGSAIWDYAEEKGRGAVLWPLRYALTGQDKSPDPFTVAGVLGKDETLRRIEYALTKLKE